MEKSFSEGGLQRCSLYTLLYSDMNYVATLLTYKFSFMFQSNFTHQEGQGGGGGGKKGQGLGRRNDVLTWLQSGHLARWSADISNNSNIFPKANILEARGEPAEQIIQ